MNFSINGLLALLFVSLFLVGCSSVNTSKVLPDKNVEYKKEKQADRGLEIPPDLTSNTIDNQGIGLDTPTELSTSYSEYKTKRQGAVGPGGQATSGVLVDIEGISVERDGQDRWLVIDAPPDSVWPRVIDFWQSNGILLEQQDPNLGTMRTTWLENKAGVKNDFVTDFIRKAFSGLYDASTRDKYRVRLEPGVETGTTELYMTHFGMEQEIATGTTGESEQYVWNIRGRDQGLEAVMLRRLMIYLGISEAQAQAELTARQELGTSRSQLVNTRDGASLIIEEPFSRAWRLTGLVLDRVGFAVEDRNRSRGIYYVRYDDPAADVKDGGWFSSLAFWKDDKNIDKVNQFQVKLVDGEKGTDVIINNEQGERDNSPTALRILTLIHEQIK